MNTIRNIQKLYIIATCFLVLSGNGILLAQQSATVNRMEEIYKTQRELTTRLQSAVYEQQFKTFVCPKDHKSFQLLVLEGDVELKNGIKQIQCPYDGFMFYPPIETVPRAESSEAGSWYSIRAPDGLFFKAKVNVEQVLNGSEVLISPYDGTQFYFRPEVVGGPGWKELKPGMRTFTSPTTGREFRALIGSDQPFVMDPYSGQTIAIEQGTTEENISSSAVASKFQDPSSTVETMFATGTSQGISKKLVQFGYSIFPSERQLKQWQWQRTSAPMGIQSNVLGPQTGMNTMNPFPLAPSNMMMGSFQQGMGQGIDMGSLSSMNQASNVIASDDYILGPGDTLIVYLWGSIRQTFPLSIDAEGKIFLPEIGPIYLGGLSFANAKELIEQRLSEKFTNFQLTVSMGRLRTIQVFVFGEVKLPGTHFISSQSTLIQALFAAWGPTKMGSLRKIKLIRGKEEFEIDLYDVLIAGDNKKVNRQLFQNDIILVPPIGGVIGIAGAVKRPAIYELASTISLERLLELSGGLSSMGYAHRIQIERVVDHQTKIVSDFEFAGLEQLKQEGQNIELKDGDLALVFPIAPLRYNYVSIEGEVLYPGDYEWKEKMTLKDLLDKAGGVLPGAHLERADLVRLQKEGVKEEIPINLGELLKGDQEQNLVLSQWDLLRVFSSKEVNPMGFIKISGAVRRPGQYLLTAHMRISDLLFKGGGLEQKADLENAELFRIDSEKGGQLISVDLRKVSKFPSKDWELQEGDHLFVRTAPTYSEQIKVQVQGEIKYPGEYIVYKGERLSSVLKRAGGFTSQAYLEGAVFTRESARKMQEEVFKQFLQTQQEAVLQEQSSLSVGYSQSQSDSRKQLIEYQKELIDLIGKGHFAGRVIIHLNPFDHFEGLVEDVVLQDGDNLYIPPAPSFVLVVGNFQQAIAINYEEGKGIEYYLRRVGGVRKTADLNNLYVIEPTGEIRSRFIRGIPVKRGDTIVVPEKFQYRTPPGLLVKDTISTLYQIGLGAIAVASIN